MSLRRVRDRTPRARYGPGTRTARQLPEDFTQPDEPRAHDRIGAERTARRIHGRLGRLRIEAERFEHDHLGRRVLRVELDEIDVARAAEPRHRERLLRGQLGRGALREVARADGLHLGDVMRALDPYGLLAELLG